VYPSVAIIAEDLLAQLSAFYCYRVALVARRAAHGGQKWIAKESATFTDVFRGARVNWPRFPTEALVKYSMSDQSRTNLRYGAINPHVIH